MTFLHCVYSNVSSNCLPEMMHNHTGCICWTFPHRVFSHEPSNCFCKRTHNCAGCICSTLRDLYSFPWGFPHFVCSSLDFQVLLPFPLSLCTVLCFSQWLLLDTGTNLMFWKISDKCGKGKVKMVVKTIRCLEYQMFCSELTWYSY